MRDAFEQALRSNKALAVSRIDPAIARALVVREQGAFDKTLSLDVLHQTNEVPSNNLQVGSGINRSELNQANFGLTQQTRAGTELGLRLLNRQDESTARNVLTNPSYTSNLVLSAIHPLARNGGPKAVTAKLKSAEAAEAAAWQRLRGDAERTVAAVERSVVELAARRQDRQVRQLVLEDALKLESYHRSRKEAGLSARSDILEAESVAQLRREDLLLAGRAVKESQDALRQLLSWQGVDSEAEIVCQDAPTPANTPYLLVAPPPFPELLERALRSRPDYLAGLEDLRSKDILLRFTSSQTRPRVDLVATQQFNGLTGELGTSLEQVARRDFHTWSLGVSIEIPFENRAAKGDHERGRLEKQAAVLSVQQVEDQARKDLATARRQVETNQERLQLARKAVELAAQKLQTEEGRFREGLLPNIELLRFQEDLATARSRLVRAEADLGLAWVALDEATGQVLERRGIAFAGGPARDGSVQPGPVTTR